MGTLLKVCIIIHLSNLLKWGPDYHVPVPRPCCHFCPSSSIQLQQSCSQHKRVSRGCRALLINILIPAISIYCRTTTIQWPIQWHNFNESETAFPAFLPLQKHKGAALQPLLHTPAKSACTNCFICHLSLESMMLKEVSEQDERESMFTHLERTHFPSQIHLLQFIHLPATSHFEVRYFLSFIFLSITDRLTLSSPFSNITQCFSHGMFLQGRKTCFNKLQTE